jgi:hypothetical protein
MSAARIACYRPIRFIFSARRFMRQTVLAIALCAVAAIGAARAAEVGESAAPESKPAAEPDASPKSPAASASAPRRCRTAPSRTPCRSRAYNAVGSPAAVVAPVEHPMMPPLGARVWRHEDPPLFDPYESAGPWYTGPWVHEGSKVAQWRYGFPGGHVDWFRGAGWRPGFGWY